MVFLFPHTFLFRKCGDFKFFCVIINIVYMKYIIADITPSRVSDRFFSGDFIIGIVPERKQRRGTRFLLVDTEAGSL